MKQAVHMVPPVTPPSCPERAEEMAPKSALKMAEGAPNSGSHCAAGSPVPSQDHFSSFPCSLSWSHRLLPTLVSHVAVPAVLLGKTLVGSGGRETGRKTGIFHLSVPWDVVLPWARALPSNPDLLETI